MTPSLSGRTATMLPGVRPIMRFASTPTATICPLLVLSATTLGSLRTIPRPRTYTSVLAVPRSTAMSRPRNVMPLLIGNGHLPVRKRQGDSSRIVQAGFVTLACLPPTPVGRVWADGPRTLLLGPARRPLNEFGEEDLDLALGRLRRVRAVHDVLPDLQGEGAADGAGVSLDRVRLAS